jgi:hypothetical protein
LTVDSTNLPTNYYLYVTNEGSGGGGTTVIQISGDGTAQVVGTGFNGPSGLAEDTGASDPLFYVSDDDNGLYTQTLSGTFSTVATGFSNPNALHLDTANNDIYIAEAGNQILQFHLGTLAPTILATNYYTPQAVTRNSSSGLVYFTDFSGDVFQIDPTTDTLPLDASTTNLATVLASAVAPNTEGGLLLNADGSTLYVADYVEGKVFEVATSDGSVSELVDFSNFAARGLALSPDEDILYISDYLNHLIVARDFGTGIVTLLANNSTASSLLDGPFGMLLSTQDYPPFGGQPDLIVDSVTGPAEACPVDSLDITLIIKNQGTGSTVATDGYFHTDLVLSTDNVFDGGDTLLIGGRDQVTDTLAPGASLTVSLAGSNDVPVTVAPGDYYLIAMVDSVSSHVAESDETNNTGYYFPITIVEDCDCEFTEYFGIDDGPTPSGAVSASFAYPQAEAARNSFYAATSTLTGFEQIDFEAVNGWGDGNFAGTGADLTYTGGDPSKVSGPNANSGSMSAGDARGELTWQGGFVDVSFFLQNTGFSAGPDNPGIGVIDGSDDVDRGFSTTVAADQFTEGKWLEVLPGQGAGGLEVRFEAGYAAEALGFYLIGREDTKQEILLRVLLVNGSALTLSLADPIVQTGDPATGGSNYGQGSVQFIGLDSPDPTDPECLIKAVRIDQDGSEGDRDIFSLDDLMFATQAFTEDPDDPIEWPAPDLIVETITGPSTPCPGDSLSLNLVIKNRGNESTVATDGYFNTDLVLSTDDVFDASDIVLIGGRDQVYDVLNPGDSLTVSLAGSNEVPPTTSPGDYYLIAMVDSVSSRVSESNEYNNTLFYHPITIEDCTCELTEYFDIDDGPSPDGTVSSSITYPKALAARDSFYAATSSLTGFETIDFEASNGWGNGNFAGTGTDLTYTGGDASKVTGPHSTGGTMASGDAQGELKWIGGSVDVAFELNNTGDVAVGIDNPGIGVIDGTDDVDRGFSTTPTGTQFTDGRWLEVLAAANSSLDEGGLQITFEPGYAAQALGFYLVGREDTKENWMLTLLMADGTVHTPPLADPIVVTGDATTVGSNLNLGSIQFIGLQAPDASDPSCLIKSVRISHQNEGGQRDIVSIDDLLMVTVTISEPQENPIEWPVEQDPLDPVLDGWLTGNGLGQLDLPVDLNGDGLPVLLEYLIGADPNAGGGSLDDGPDIMEVNSNIYFGVSLISNRAYQPDGVNVNLVGSNDLGGSDPFVPLSTTLVVTDLGNGKYLHFYRQNEHFGSPTAKKFFYIEVKVLQVESGNP